MNNPINSINDIVIIGVACLRYLVRKKVYWLLTLTVRCYYAYLSRTWSSDVVFRDTQQWVGLSGICIESPFFISIGEPLLTQTFHQYNIKLNHDNIPKNGGEPTCDVIFTTFYVNNNHINDKWKDILFILFSRKVHSTAHCWYEEREYNVIHK